LFEKIEELQETEEAVLTPTSLILFYEKALIQQKGMVVSIY
jgi:hypothetical protein